ncbi:MAG: hypothetical protein JWO05_3460 [Gemmatimonadetes bacterium]|nr:hypothetical protein [Gemmatimonadota bacterium]
MRLDSLLRGAAFRGLARLMPRGGNPLEARRVLVLRNDRIGDMLMTTGLLRELRRAHPGMEIHVAASAANADVIRGNPNVHAVHVVSGGVAGYRAARELFAPMEFDAVIDAFALKPRVNTGVALMMLASQAPVRVGIGSRVNDFLYSHRVRPMRDDAHHVEFLGALAAPFGVNPGVTDFSPELVRTALEREHAEAFWAGVPGSGPRLLVNLSSGETWRRWPDERFVAVLRAMRETRPDVRVAVTAAPSERVSARTIAAAVHGVPLDASLRDALAVVGAAELVLTPDTSIAHAAAAAGVPMVVMYPSSVSAQFEPYRAKGKVVRTEAATLMGMPVAAVWEGVKAELLRLSP